MPRSTWLSVLGVRSALAATSARVRPNSCLSFRILEPIPNGTIALHKHVLSRLPLQDRSIAYASTGTQIREFRLQLVTTLFILKKHLNYKAKMKLCQIAALPRRLNLVLLQLQAGREGTTRGAVESACKWIIGRRLKQSGMIWNRQDAKAMARLQATVLSNRGTHSGPPTNTSTYPPTCCLNPYKSGIHPFLTFSRL